MLDPSLEPSPCAMSAALGSERSGSLRSGIAMNNASSYIMCYSAHWMLIRTSTTLADVFLCCAPQAYACSNQLKSGQKLYKPAASRALQRSTQLRVCRGCTLVDLPIGLKVGSSLTDSHIAACVCVLQYHHNPQWEKQQGGALGCEGP